MDRRRFLALAAAFGAQAVWARRTPARSQSAWTERRDLFPEGVASGDPDEHSVICWTRRPYDDGRSKARLRIECAEDPLFVRVVAAADTTVEAASDWTCRVLIGALRPATEYWYRFIDDQGFGSRVGRTLTAPSLRDTRPVNFAFVSCQNVNQGAQHAYRRMIFDDEKAAPEERLGFVLHLGDFIYELVWYPEDRPKGMYDRRLRDIVRYAHGEKVQDFHIPTDVDDYRAVYRAYLRDPDLQDARARWPFVSMWDNHEFSWLGWQGLQEFDGKTRPAQTRKVAANQAWFEYQPARVTRPNGALLERFEPPRVVDAPIDRFDDDGLGTEPNNLAAIASLTGYRALRWGANVDLIITDQHSYRSQEPLGRKEAEVFTTRDFLDFMPEEAMVILDAGRSYNGGKPPATIRYGDADVPNFRRADSAQTILGAKQKRWFLQRLATSRATWKIWGNTLGTLDWRADPQNLPSGLTKPWPGAGYAGFGGGDHSSAYVERGEIYDFVAKRRITGFAAIAGDRHSFWAGLAAKALPPAAFEPVGVAFVTGSISAPGLVEAEEHALRRDHPLRPLYLIDRPDQPKPEASVNLLLKHGVRSCLEYASSGDLAKARAVGNPELAPHLSFIDIGGHGYSTVRVTHDRMDVAFVCIPRPLERSEEPDGGPVRYRVVHSAALWPAGAKPVLTQRVIEGDPALSV
jgi:alkaline phosphatase D